MPEPERMPPEIEGYTFQRLIELKRQEWDTYRVQVTPFEVESFLPVL